MARLEVKNAGRRIGGRWLWRGVSFELAAGHRLAVVGPSGSGKTLLLRAISGLERLDEGDVLLERRSISEWSMPNYRSHVIFLPHSPALLDTTVEANLRAVFDFKAHAGAAFDPPRMLQYLRLLDRDESFLSRSSDVLSGGEQQIVAFLRALQLNPDVLLLDEPTANLDQGSTLQIERLVSAWLNGCSGRAVVWTSHRPEQLDRMTDERIDVSRFSQVHSQDDGAPGPGGRRGK